MKNIVQCASQTEKSNNNNAKYGSNTEDKLVEDLMWARNAFTEYSAKIFVQMNIRNNNHNKNRMRETERERQTMIVVVCCAQER